jgi:hypothetical protein
MLKRRKFARYKFNHFKVQYFNIRPQQLFMSENVDRIQTRAKNANQHPGLGLLGPKRKRRTQVEMQKDREQEAEEKKAGDELRQKKMRSIASMEDDLTRKDHKANAGVALKRTVHLRPLKQVSQKITNHTTSVIPRTDCSQQGCW